VPADDLGVSVTGVMSARDVAGAADTADTAGTAGTGGTGGTDRRRLDGVIGGGFAVATGPFPRHFGARLVAERRRSRRPLWIVATRGTGEFTLRDLRDAEAGLLPLDAATVVRLADLYGVAVRETLPPTARGLEIRDGSLHAGGVSVDYRSGDTRSMVDAYFRLARTLRSIDGESAPVRIRHDDLVAMVEHLRGDDPAARYLQSVLLMATAERRVVVGSLIAGAAALGLAGLTDGSIPAVMDEAELIDVTDRSAADHLEHASRG
jgi:hypothetical protein